jgi:hypothetical protein
MPAKAKLPKGKGKRMPLNMRTTPETRKRLERAAADSGRSLVQEVEARLEQSVMEDDALGGRQLRALFGMLGNAAVLIEEQTGEPYFEDWRTWVAVQAAWRRLIAAFGPKWPEENVSALEEAIATPVPKFPMPPPPLKPMGQGSLEESIEHEKARKDYEAALLIFEKENAEFKRAGEAFQRIIEDEQAQMALGKNVAASLLPEKPKKEG